MRPKVLISTLVAFVIITLTLGAPNTADAQCIENCTNPTLIDNYIGPVGCGTCQWFQQYYYYTETWKYSCANGGTCTVVEHYEMPCGQCPW